jgi:hypothetical protein
MIFSDLYTQVERNAGESGGEYRSDVRRWLNLARSEISDEAVWRDALRSTTITTSAGTTDGLYNIEGYEKISGQYLKNETNNTPIGHESYEALKSIDPNETVSGAPYFWADAGSESSRTGNFPRIFLHPIPDAAFVIRFNAYIRLTDIVESDDGLANDPYFGWLSQWAACFIAGIDYYRMLDDSEDAQELIVKRSLFTKAIERRKKNNSVNVGQSIRLRNIRNEGRSRVGRLDPAHYSNR